jgi:hypothetical protein
MISSIFSKTKPVNYLLLLGFLFFFYWAVHYFRIKRIYSLDEFLFWGFLLGILLFSVFLVNFIVKRNQITGSNSYTMFYYVLLIAAFPEVMTDENAIPCSIFLLLAARRIISMKSLKNLKSKIFDATLYTALASLFYDWALLYLILVFVAIYFYEPKNIKNWLVPVTALCTVALIASGILIVIGIPDYLYSHYSFSLSLDRNFAALWSYSSKLILYAILLILTGFLAFLKMGKLGLGRIITVRLIAISASIGLLVTFLKSNADVYPVLVTFFPGAILITKYVEVIKRQNVRELVLIISALIPFVLLLL